MDAETEHPSLLNHRQKKHCLTKPPQQLQFLPFTIECSDMLENHSYSSLHGWHADVWTHGLWGTEAQQHCVLQPISEVSLNLSQKCVWRTGRRRHFVQANVHLEAVHAPRTLLETTQTQRFFIFFSNTSNTRGYRLSGQRGAEYLVLHALLDAPVVPFQFCILWKWVSLPADWHATFNRRHHCLRTHTQNKWVDAQ